MRLPPSPGLSEERAISIAADAAPSKPAAPVGYWCPVLHAHLPYVRHPEYPDFLEEDWLFEAVVETYVPLIRVLDGLLADGVEYRLTMTLSPPLLSMLRDPLLVERCNRYLDRLVTLAEKEV